MTQQEKDEMNSRRMERLAKERKNKIVWVIVLPVAAFVISLIIGAAGMSKQSEIADATVLDGMTLGDFLEKEGNGNVIYTGTAVASDPVTVKGEDGEYIMIRKKVEQIQKVRNEQEDKYEEETTEISDRSAHCEDIELDDMIIVYDAFHSLPTTTEHYSEGPDNNEFRTEYTYIPASISGTFYIKCSNGDVDSIDYYESEDVGGQSKSRFGLALVLIWLAVITIDIVMIVKIVKLGKVLKGATILESIHMADGDPDKLRSAWLDSRRKE